MRDPVILPDSQVIVDRSTIARHLLTQVTVDRSTIARHLLTQVTVDRSTIARHQLTQAADPFSRKDLTIDMAQPSTLSILNRRFARLSVGSDKSIATVRVKATLSSTTLNLRTPRLSTPRQPTPVMNMYMVTRGLKSVSVSRAAARRAPVVYKARSIMRRHLCVKRWLNTLSSGLPWGFTKSDPDIVLLGGSRNRRWLGTTVSRTTPASVASIDGSQRGANGLVAVETKAMRNIVVMAANLRTKTGAGMMSCKKALAECNGDVDAAIEWLRKKGLSGADKKAGRIAAEGGIFSYVHPGSRLGVMVEVNCETDFVAASDTFQSLAKSVAMQLAASPTVMYVSVEDIPAEVFEKEKAMEMLREDMKSKPENIRAKIAEGRAQKLAAEMALLPQPYLVDGSKTVEQAVKEAIAALGEKISIRRFVKFELGDGIEKKKDDFAAEVAAATGTA
eukprot:gene16756-23030_t